MRSFVSPYPTVIHLVVLCFFAVSSVSFGEPAANPNFAKGAALYQHGEGNPGDFPEALEYFLKAAEGGHSDSQFFAGRMYHLEPAVGIDIDSAKKWYRLAAEQDHVFALNNLGNIYRDAGGPHRLTLKYLMRAAELKNEQASFSIGNGYRYGRYGLRRDPEKAMQYLERAAEWGQPFAAYDVGEIYREGWSSIERDVAKAVHFHQLAAKQNHSMSMYWLGGLLWSEELQKVRDMETIQKWRDAHVARYDRFLGSMTPGLTSARQALERGNRDEAYKLLSQAHKTGMEYLIDDWDSYPFKAIWDEAQFRSGRTNREWAYLLYSFIYELEQDRGKDAANLLHVRSCINDELTEIGRFGLLRESLEDTKRLFHESEGVDIDEVLSKAVVGPSYEVLRPENLPVYTDRKEEHGESKNQVLGAMPMNGLDNLADERLAVGDWESVIILAEWLSQWNETRVSEGREPWNSYPGFHGELIQIPLEMKMEAFRALGLPEREIAACKEIIELNWESYGGRRRQLAQVRFFDLLVKGGRAADVDLKELEQLEETIRLNATLEAHRWMSAKLVSAKVVAQTRNYEEGYALVQEVLRETKTDVLGPLRLNALMTAAELSLNAGVTDGVAEVLSDALEKAREVGLLLEELEVYQLYVDYLFAIGDYEAAAEMQNRVIDLIRGLRLLPRMPAALARLAEIEGEQRQDLVGANNSSDEEVPSDLAQNTSSTKTADDPSILPASGQVPLELQPKGIRTQALGSATSSVFVLINSSTRPGEGTLRFESSQFDLTLEEQSPEQITIICQAGSSSTESAVQCTATVPGGKLLPIVLVAEGAGFAEEATITIAMDPKSLPETSAGHSSEWVLSHDGSNETIAVVDAARLTGSSFALVPVYHQLDSAAESDQAALRVIASEPTRVEGFDADGALLFVDAEGNGSFKDPGDLIATDRMENIFPVLTAGPQTGRIALRYRPHAASLSKRVKVKIETRALGTSVWNTDAIDWLEP